MRKYKTNIEQFISYAKKNSVQDYITESTKFILICESPHTEELEKGLPLVGSAGRFAAKYLDLSPDIGLCEHLKSGSNSLIGTINVCKAPLQKTKSSKQSEFNFAKLNRIRKGYKYKFRHKDVSINEIEQYIFEEFNKRLRFYIENIPSIRHLIFCGEFSKHYLNNSTKNYLEEKNILISFLPHPSMNRWAKVNENQKYILEKLKNAIKN